MAKYDGLRKTNRDKILMEYRRAHPELSLEEIGRSFNICRERVRQIVRDYDQKVESATPKAG